ncbi:MAG: AI-2E family transporter [Opitutaceae bacterium]|nr:AI-2E family transporter [Opitutaceae bacterium]
MRTPDDAPFLSPSQRRIAAVAISFAALLVIAALGVITIALLGRFLSEFSLVFWPLAIAGILGVILQPVVTFLESRLRGHRLAAVILLYSLVSMAAAALILAVAPAVLSQIIDFFAYLPVLWERTLGWVEANFPEWLAVARRYLESPAVQSLVNSLAQQAQDVIAQLAPSLKKAGAGLFGLFGFVAAFAIIPVYLFFFLLSSDADPVRRIDDNLGFLRPQHREDVVFLLREFLGIIVAFFRGQLLIGLIMGVLLAIGFSIAGLRFGLALGLIIGLLNIIPYLGSILGLSVALPLALLQPQGGWGLMAIVLGVFVAVQIVESWLLTPRIMGEQTGLHPVAIIFAVFFWGQALGGVLGMLLAVPLTAFFVTAWRLLKRKYFGLAQTG